MNARRRGRLWPPLYRQGGLNCEESARLRYSSDAALAGRLEQIEILFDLHSAAMNPKAAGLLLDRIRRVRLALQQRAKREDSAREKMALTRGDFEQRAARAAGARGKAARDKLARIRGD